MEARDTLPEKMQRLGYDTAAFTPNPFTSRHFGFDQGFDHFQDFMNESVRGRLYQKVFNGFLKEENILSIARVPLNFWNGEEVFKPWESYYDDIVEWIRGAEEPYFLWVFMMDAHNPYLAPSSYRSQSYWKQFYANFEFWRQSHETPFSETVHKRLVTAYDDAVRYADAFLGQLREDLAATDPIMAVHGDHGEAFGEHGTYGHEPYLYPENVHVPLVVEGIGDETLVDPVSLRDLSKILIENSVTEVNWISKPVLTRTRQGSAAALLDQDGIVGSEQLRFPMEDQLLGTEEKSRVSNTVKSITTEDGVRRTRTGQSKGGV
jgi:arylsulfatase